MKKLVILFVLLLFGSCSRPGSENSMSPLSPQAFAEELKSGEAILLDVRTPKELQSGFLEGARNLDFNSEGFEGALDTLDHSKKYLVYCAIGKRSSKAADRMRAKGFTNVRSLEGGLNAWVAAGLPTQKP